MWDEVFAERDRIYASKNISTKITFEVRNETTLSAANRLVNEEGIERVLCLNFASAKNPGGGFLNGSQAQEESLARAELQGCILVCYNTLSGTSMASPHVAGVAALCINSGACSGLTSSQMAAKFKTEAANQPVSYGFIGDPYSPNGTRYYGNLIYGGGY